MSVDGTQIAAEQPATSVVVNTAPVASADPTTALLSSVLGPLAVSTAENVARKTAAEVLAPHTAALADLQGQVATALGGLVAQPDVQALVDQATAGLRTELTAFQDDVLAHRSDIYSQLAKAGSSFLSDKRTYYLLAGIFVALIVFACILAYAYVFNNNQRAGQILQPVGAAILVLIPTGGLALKVSHAVAPRP